MTIVNNTRRSVHLLAAWLASSVLSCAAAAPSTQERLYTQLADHNLLQIMLVVPKSTPGANLSRRADAPWALRGDVLCVETSGLREEIVTRDVLELPDEARRNALAGSEFYRAVRFTPARVISPTEDRDYDADLNAALRRFAHAKLAKKVAIEINHNGAGCMADVHAVPAIRFYARANSQPQAGSWLLRMQRGDVAVLGTLSVSELRAARTERIAAASGQSLRAVRAEPTKSASARTEDVSYGALRIEGGRNRLCYVASDDPLPQLVAWTMAESDAVKRWMGSAAEPPKAIADLDAVVAELRKPAPQRQCTLLVAPTPTLQQVKAGLERDKLNPALYPETASTRQVLGAFGFRSIDELRFAREVGVASSEQFAQLRALGLDTRAGFDSAAQRYAWVFGNAKLDAETLALFVRDEREAAARGITVKMLRAERSKRDQARSREAAPVPG